MTTPWTPVVFDQSFRWSRTAPLPHLEAGPRPQSVTFRVAGSLPPGFIERCRAQYAHLPEPERLEQCRQRIEEALDRGGHTALSEPRVSRMVAESLRFFDGKRYTLHAWVVMPNHVHAEFTPSPGREMSRIVQGWKSFTAHEANRMLGRRGEFWAPDYLDRLIRDEAHLANAAEYIEWNPVLAGLCRVPWQYPWSSAWGRVPRTENAGRSSRLASEGGSLQ